MNTNLKPLKLFKGKASLDARKARSGYIFVLPFILGLVLVYLPILLDSIWLSFGYLETVLDPTTGELVSEMRYVGFEYYLVAFDDEDFLTALLESLQQLLFQVPAIIIFSLFVAVVLNQKMLGRALFRAIFFIPVIISTGLMDSINAQDQMTQDSMDGIDNGMQSGNEDTSNQIISTLDVEMIFRSMKLGGQLVDVIVQLVNDIYNIINYSGVQMLIFLAALQSVSPAIYEACRVDGATGWETFWKVTFPMISPMILVNGIYTIIDSFTRRTNPVMVYIDEFIVDIYQKNTMSWIYFAIVILILAIFAGVASSFIFYQRRD